MVALVFVEREGLVNVVRVEAAMRNADSETRVDGFRASVGQYILGIVNVFPNKGAANPARADSRGLQQLVDHPAGAFEITSHAAHSVVNIADAVERDHDVKMNAGLRAEFSQIIGCLKY